MIPHRRCRRQEPSAADREALRAVPTPEITRWQYVHGVADESLVSPGGYTLDSHYLAQPVIRVFLAP